MVESISGSSIDQVVGRSRLMSGTTEEHQVQVTGGSPRSMSLTRVKTKTWLVESAHCWWWRCEAKDCVEM